MKNSIFSIKPITYKKLESQIYVLLFTLFLSFQLSAQDIKFYKVNVDLTKTSDIVNDKNIDIVRLESLMMDLNPSIYLLKGVSRTSGNGAPTVIDTDVQSFSELYRKNPEFNQVEVIKININSASDLSTSLDLDKLESFYRLKYIYAEFAFDACGGQKDDCLRPKMQGIIKGIDSNAIVIFKLSIPN